MTDLGARETAEYKRKPKSRFVVARKRVKFVFVYVVPMVAYTAVLLLRALLLKIRCTIVKHEWIVGQDDNMRVCTRCRRIELYEEGNWISEWDW